MTDIGIDLQVLFGKSGEMREAFRLAVTLPADERGADTLIRHLRGAVVQVLSAYLAERSDRVDLHIVRGREEAK